MTDRNGLQRDTSLAPGIVQERRSKALCAAAEHTLPPVPQETLLLELGRKVLFRPGRLERDRSSTAHGATAAHCPSGSTRQETVR